METPLERSDGARPAVPRDIELRPTDDPADRASDTPPELGNFFDWLLRPNRDASAALSASAFALLLIIGLIALAYAAIWPSAGPPSDGQSASSLSPNEKRLASKAAYRARRYADPAFRERERERVRKWRRESPDKARAQKRAARSANYHRPFVAIDSEGQNYPGEDIVYDGVRYFRHDTYLWGAAADDGRPPAGSLSELRAAVESASCLSMFKVRFQFPTYEKYDPDARKAVFVPFYPLPYRDKRGGILFPASGYGWYMRDDVLAAISWLEHFVPDYPRPHYKHNQMTQLEFEEAWIFEPGHDNRTNRKPLEFVREWFNRRRQIKDGAEQTGKYDIREKTIKLALNSIYGKFAQSVGGDGEAPSVANPYYAAATTAYCRRRLLEAALIDPHAIVFFATDGIVSTRPLNGLEHGRKQGDIVDLGDWEYCEADSGLFVMPGVYTYGKIAYDKNGARTIKPVTKLRGGDPKKYAAQVNANQWLIENVLAAWRKPFDPHKPEQFPRIVATYQKYITAGNALASRHRWKLAGRWTARPGEAGAGTREINVHSVGNKRELIPDETCWPDYVSVPGREARRCHELIRTLPALNNDRALSRPRMPEWLDERIGEKVEEQEEQEEIASGLE